MRDGFGLSLLRGLLVAGAVAGAMRVYRHDWRRPTPPVAGPAVARLTIIAPLPAVSQRPRQALRDGTIDLGNLSTIGKGGPPQCASDVVAPWVLKVQSIDRPTPEICDAIRPLRRTIRACLDAGLGENALGGDFVALYLSVGRSGRVESLGINNGSGEMTSQAAARLDTCIRRAMHRLRLGLGEADEITLDMNLF